MQETVLDRAKVAQKDKWNVEALFPDMGIWEKKFSLMTPSEGRPKWQQLEEFKGRLGESPETLKSALECYFQLSRELSTLYTYAHLRHDEEITLDQNKTAYDRALAAMHEFSHAAAWFEPELLALDDKLLQTLIGSPLLAPYRFHIEKTVRIKKHLLPPEGEALWRLPEKHCKPPIKRSAPSMMRTSNSAWRSTAKVRTLN